VSGYAATARIERVRPRRAAPAGPDFRAFGRAETRDDDGAGGDVELAETEVRDDLIDRAEAFRDRWSQLTFYLFDPESWR
jgi:hypothetical protein